MQDQGKVTAYKFLKEPGSPYQSGFFLLGLFVADTSKKGRLSAIFGYCHFWYQQNSSDLLKVIKWKCPLQRVLSGNTLWNMISFGKYFKVLNFMGDQFLRCSKFLWFNLFKEIFFLGLIILKGEILTFRLICPKFISY